MRPANFIYKKMCVDWQQWEAWREIGLLAGYTDPMVLIHRFATQGFSQLNQHLIAQAHAANEAAKLGKEAQDEQLRGLQDGMQCGCDEGCDECSCGRQPESAVEEGGVPTVPGDEGE